MPGKKRGGFRRVLLIAAIVIAAAAAGSALYVQDYYRADARAAAVLSQPQGSGISVTTRGDLTVLAPDQPSGTGFIFYPGGKVEETAYLPLLERIAKRGTTCVLVKMPFRLAVLGVNRADAAFAQLPGVTRWYIGGHSLGGAMASRYADAHADRLAGLILLAAYPTSPPQVPTMALYGSEDGVLKREKLSRVADTRVIPGGNHAGFGHYGEQSGDGKAAITSDEQQDITAQAVYGFLLTRVDASRAYERR